MTRFFQESISVVLLSLVVNFAAEFVARIFIYNTSDYKSMSRQLKKVSEELDKKKDQIVSASEEKKQKKAIQKLKDEERTLKQEISGKSMKTNIIISMLMMLIMGVFRSFYDGVVVAKLPFEPLPMLRGFFHSGIRGTNYYDCSMMGIYILCNMTIRQTLKMIMGTNGPRNGSGFAAIWEQAEEKAEAYYKED
ncbi:transmembrane and coiled-coil domains protein 1-like protein [Blastocystis sp. ATCC 50177/Nand II]|uniref:Transmembrane and coiled-coil domains protein 1-like protein n=1 Tax=Blastocystis sp. subtype 1 (strain ATCC 50177 / NandII) TaxID=478820 RepID=A0A196SJY1_BLAHN|nr:transmembrane and coiled-coil domains protein 1-like protein [Blastocystis sp. ATCC 50177/Nand II]